MFVRELAPIVVCTNNNNNNNNNSYGRDEYINSQKEGVLNIVQ